MQFRSDTIPTMKNHLAALLRVRPEGSKVAKVRTYMRLVNEELLGTQYACTTRIQQRHPRGRLFLTPHLSPCISIIWSVNCIMCTYMIFIYNIFFKYVILHKYIFNIYHIHIL